jgi:hypothetical protein
MSNKLGSTETISSIIIDMLVDDVYHKKYEFKDIEVDIKIKKKDGE